MKKILIIHTGGTFGMMPMKPSETLAPGEIQNQLINYVPELQEIAEIETIIPYNIDSSNVAPSDWQILARLIIENRERYNGFVIIHGTDTMAYTASALSFMLLNFDKPVILTGAQRPLANIRNDARTNLINAVEIATIAHSEVAIFFGTRLYRGNRATKISATRYEAFESPNFPPLAEVGLDIKFNQKLEKSQEAFSPMLNLDSAVIALRVFPGMPHALLHQIIDSDVRAIVLEGYGAGNVPIGEESLLPFIKEATDSGKLLAINTQCLHGNVKLELYHCGRSALEYGAIGCHDMTMEASLVKFMVLLGKYSDHEQVRQLFIKNLAGELTDK